MSQEMSGMAVRRRPMTAALMIAALLSVGGGQTAGAAVVSADPTVTAGLTTSAGSRASADIAGSWTVMSSDDVVPGADCDALAETGTLRWAVQQFHAASALTSGDYVIDIQASAPIVLAADCDLHIDSPSEQQATLTLRGQGSGTTVIDASAAQFGLDPYVAVEHPFEAVTVEGVSITGDRLGFETFGASLTLRDVAVTDVSGQYVNPAATITGLRFGASPEVTVENSSFTTHTGNLAFNGGWPWYGAGTITIADTAFTLVPSADSQRDAGHGVQLGGGADYTLDNVTAVNQIEETTFAFFSVGGSIESGGTGPVASLTVARSTVESDSGFIVGNFAGDLTISDSTFTNTNHTRIPTWRPFEMYCVEGSTCHLLMNRSLVDSVLNPVYSPTVFHAPPAVIENSTFRLARVPGPTGDGPVGVYGQRYEGAVDEDDLIVGATESPTVVMRNNTVMGDSINLLADDWGYRDDSTEVGAELYNNVVDSGVCSPVSFSVNNVPTAVAPAIVAEGNVVTSNALTGADYCGSQIALADGAFTVLDVPSMMLGPLADNGGRSSTYRPQPGSPLVDSGVMPPDADETFLAGDQRGSGRVRGGVIEVGAVEIQGGLVQFVEDVTVDATDGEIVFTLTRTEGSEGPLSVPVRTSDGTAEAGVNYGATTATVTWADGDADSKTVTVPVMVVLEGGTVDLTATLSVPPGKSASVGAKPTAVGTIVNPTLLPGPDPSESPDPDTGTLPGIDGTGGTSAGAGDAAGRLAGTGADMLPLVLLAAALLVGGVLLRRMRASRAPQVPKTP